MAPPVLFTRTTGSWPFNYLESMHSLLVSGKGDPRGAFLAITTIGDAHGDQVCGMIPTCF